MKYRVPTSLRFFAVILLLFIQIEMVLSASVQPRFSTYFGGADAEDTARAVAVDVDGNILVAGGTRSTDFPTTPGGMDRVYGGTGGTVGSIGGMDGFVAKFSPEGKLLWSTYIGGPNYDRVYTIRVDKAGFIYLAGRAGEGFPTTPETAQPKFAGDNKQNRAYGKQDGFITKLRPDGSGIVWSTYFGTSGPSIIRDMDLDAEGSVFVSMIEMKTSCPHITPGVFQPRQGGAQESIVAKISADGRRVLWCSYFGGAARDQATSLRVDSQGRPVISGTTFSSDLPVTAGGPQARLRGKSDAFVARISADGSRLEYCSLIGGSDTDGGAGKHGLVLDAKDRPVLSGYTHSRDFPTTKGAFQEKYAGGFSGKWDQMGDRFVAIFSNDGKRVEAATFVGGAGGRDGGEGIALDGQGNCLLSGFSFSPDFPVSSNATQRSYMGARKRHNPYSGGGDATVVVLSPDLSQAKLATFVGGREEDSLRACATSPSGAFVLVGETRSRDFPVRAAHQTSLRGTHNIVIVSYPSIADW